MLARAAASTSSLSLPDASAEPVRRDRERARRAHAYRAFGSAEGIFGACFGCLGVLKGLFGPASELPVRSKLLTWPCPVPPVR